MKKKILSLIIGLSISLLIPINTSAYSNTTNYTSSNYYDGRDNGWDTNYEYDWGLYNWAADSADHSLLNSSTPKKAESRYDCTTELRGISTEQKGDVRGWMQHTSIWANNITNHIEKNYTDPNGYGNVRIPNEKCYTDYRCDYLINRIYYFRTFYPRAIVKYSDAYSIGGNDGLLWTMDGYIQRQFNRWAIQWYKRLKPKTGLGNSYIVDNGENTYSKDQVLWMQSGQKTFRTWSYDSYSDSYGQKAQYDGGIKLLELGICGTDINYMSEVNRESGEISKLDTWDTKTRKESNIITEGLYGDDYEYIEHETSLNRATKGAYVTFKATDGSSYKLLSNGANKWERWATSSDSYTYLYNISGLKNYVQAGGPGKEFYGFRYGYSRNTEIYTQLKIDDQGPVWNKISADTSSSSQSIELKIEGLKDVSGPAKDKEGCGVDKIEVIVTSKSNPTKTKKYNLPIKNGQSDYSCSIDISSIGSKEGDIFDVSVKAIDKLGNVSTESNDVVVFNLSAKIYNSTDTSSNIFRRGEQGILEIKTYGFVEKVDVIFETELSSLDDRLDKVYTLEPKVTDTINHTFYIPLETVEDREYKVKVVAHKGDKSKTVYPTLNITGNILDDVRSRIRYKRD